MTTCFLAPDPIQSTQFIPGGNTPANGGQLFFYLAGSSTKQTVYKDNTASVAWTNPIVLDSGGNLPSGGEVWFPTGITFKAVFAPSTDTDPPSSPYWTKDNLAGINDTSSSQSEWVTGPTPTFVTGSQFTLSGDQTGTFVKSRRLKFTVTAGTVYGTITKSAFAANTTTVDVAFAAGALDAGLSAVSYSLIAPDNPSINADYVNKQASSAVATATTDIWGKAGNSLHITGNVTTAIQAFSTQPYTGALRHLIFDGISQLTHNASSLAMPGNANYTTAVGDSALVYADNTTTRVLAMMRANGAAVSAAKQFIMTTTAVAGTAQLDITGLTGYTSYEFLLDELTPSSNGPTLLLRCSTSNGVSFDSGANYAYANTFGYQSSSLAFTSNSDSSMKLFPSAASTSGNGMSGLLTLIGATNALAHKVICGTVSGYDATAVNSGVCVGGRYFGGGNVNAVRFLPGSSTWAGGTISVWGHKNVV